MTVLQSSKVLWCAIVGFPTVSHAVCDCRFSDNLTRRTHLCWRIVEPHYERTSVGGAWSLTTVEYLRVVVSESVQWSGKGDCTECQCSGAPSPSPKTRIADECIERGASLQTHLGWRIVEPHCCAFTVRLHDVRLSVFQQPHTRCAIVGFPTISHGVRTDKTAKDLRCCQCCSQGSFFKHLCCWQSRINRSQRTGRNAHNKTRSF